MIEWWGPVIHEYYAGTEGNGFCYCNSEEWLTHKGTVGRALTAPVLILDEEGNPVPTGEEGTVYFGATAAGRVFEYHNDPDKTAGSYRDDGASTLGDIGKLDEDGFLYLTDRKANMIITGGVNVYPQETENVLVVHPDVADAAVIGVPNEDFGEEVKAVVQLVDPSRRRPRDGAGPDRPLPGAPGRHQVPPLGRLPRRAPPPPHRQALQAPAQGRVLGRPRQPHLRSGRPATGG